MMLNLCNIKNFFSLQKIEEFVQSSGEDGVVVFSLGSIVQNLTEDKANLIASALAQIPQKVSITFNPSGQLFTSWRQSVADDIFLGKC